FLHPTSLTEIYTLSLHDALPILRNGCAFPHVLQFVVFLRQPALVLPGLSVVTNRCLSCPFRGFKALRGLARFTLAYAFGLDSAYFFLMWASTARTPLYILETLPSSLSVTPRACETYCTEP